MDALIISPPIKLFAETSAAGAPDRPNTVDSVKYPHFGNYAMNDAAVCGGPSVIYLAGGCFWGVEKVFSGIPGVAGTECGYANGYDRIIPDYMTVCSGKFGYCEAVRVSYDPSVVKLERILDAFFVIIDPSLLNRQGNDRGIQYRTGIYWADEPSGGIVAEYVEKERKKHSEFRTEAGPLINYFPAEEKHQHYLDRNPAGYCHISREEMEHVRRMFSCADSFMHDKE